MNGEKLGDESVAGGSEQRGWGTLEQVPYRSIWKETYDRVRGEMVSSNLSLDDIEMKRGEFLLDSEEYGEMEGSRRAILEVKLEQMQERYPLEKKGRLPWEQTRIEEKYRGFARDYLRLSGYPKEIVGDMVAAMGGAISKEKKQNAALKALNPDAKTLDLDEYKKRLEGMSLLAGEIGSEGVKRLWKECGILNFSNYPLHEMVWQERWLRGDEEARKRYSDSENPTVMFVRDGIGDWNGAFGSTDDFEGERPMLAFEVGKNTVLDLAKCNAAVQKRRPVVSTLVVGAHGGSSGHEMSFGGVSLGSRKYEKGAELAWEDPVMTNILRATKPDKYGKRTIIIKSCSQGKEKGGVAEVVANLAHEGQSGDVATEVFASTMPDHLGANSGVVSVGIEKNIGKGALVSVEKKGGAIKRKKYTGDRAIYDEGAYRKAMYEHNPNSPRESIENMLENILSGRDEVIGKYEVQGMVPSTGVAARIRERWKRRKNGEE